MNYVTIEYAGIKLEMAAYLALRWPYNLPLHKFPSFCGLGNGLLEWIVPDTLFGSHANPACLIHDFDFEFSEATFTAFVQANKRLLNNLISCNSAQLSGDRLAAANAVARLYYYFVMSVGWVVFDPYQDLSTNLLKSSRIKSKLLILDHVSNTHILSKAEEPLAKVK